MQFHFFLFSLFSILSIPFSWGNISENLPYPETLPYQESNNTVFNILVIRGEFIDAPTPCSLDHLYNVLSNGTLNVKTNFIYSTQSHILLNFTIDPQVYFLPYFTNSSVCNDREWDSALKSQVNHWNLQSYHVRLSVIPRTLKCAAGVTGTFQDCTKQSANVCWSLVTSCSPRIITHELFHNLNLNHAGVDPENDNAINNWGDSSDVMSYAGGEWTKLNAVHLWQKGWIKKKSMVEGNFLADGIYKLSPLDAPFLNQPTVYRFPDPSTFNESESQPLNKAYFVSVRAKTDVYSNSLDSSFTFKMAIHYYRRTYQPCAGEGCVQLRLEGKPTALVVLLSPGDTFQLPEGRNLTVINTLSFKLSTPYSNPWNFPQSTPSFDWMSWIIPGVLGVLGCFLVVGGIVLYKKTRNNPEPSPEPSPELDPELDPEPNPEPSPSFSHSYSHSNLDGFPPLPSINRLSSLSITPTPPQIFSRLPKPSSHNHSLEWIQMNNINIESLSDLSDLSNLSNK